VHSAPASAVPEEQSTLTQLPEQALHDVEADASRPQDRGQYQFALAQPLWELGRERPRALALAQQARDGLAQQAQYVEDAKTVEDWLKGKRAR
jgi:hypothetical protein